MRYAIIILILSFLSCRTGKIDLSNYNWDYYHNQKKVINYSKVGLVGYFIIKVRSGKLALGSNYDLCNALLPNLNKLTNDQCFKVINDFYLQNEELDWDLISNRNDIEILDIDLINYYCSLGIEKIVNNSYDSNCIPKYGGNISNFGEQIAALIILGVEVYGGGYSGYDFMINSDYCND